MTATLPPEVIELRSTRCIRERCERVLEAGIEGQLSHFNVDLDRLAQAVRVTAEVTRVRYPSLAIPAHSRFGHFDAGGIARLAALEERLAALDRLERARRLVEVVVISVLVDAGAGPDWRYSEAESGTIIGRSEGLAIASLHWLRSGALSTADEAYRVDASRLTVLTQAELSRAFQVHASNPLVGVEGRVSLLRALGAVIEARPEIFTAGRLGGIIDTLLARAHEGAITADAVLGLVLDGLANIWPGRLAAQGVPLGDVWRHPAAGGEGATAGLLPLHKLSQWLTYSLLYPLNEAGLKVIEIDRLTGLAEYRNGGLFVDTGVLVPKYAGVTEAIHPAGSELVVEWRALTLALLDRMLDPVREELGLRASDLPLAAMLEGGTWAAGRQLAKQRRPDGAPPIRILSDGTVF